jgi:hypothetical protein
MHHMGPFRLERNSATPTVKPFLWHHPYSPSNPFQTLLPSVVVVVASLPRPIYIYTALQRFRIAWSSRRGDGVPRWSGPLLLPHRTEREHWYGLGKRKFLGLTRTTLFVVTQPVSLHGSRLPPNDAAATGSSVRGWLVFPAAPVTSRAHYSFRCLAPGRQT